MEKELTDFSDYIVYVDESGDHNLNKIDQAFPVFALVFCIVKKDEYINQIVPKIQSLKFDYFGHDNIILHEREIRKQLPPYGFLRTNKELRQKFLSKISNIIGDAPIKLIGTVIHKQKLTKHYSNPYNPYKLGLLFCMEHLLDFLKDNQQKGKTVHIQFEKRGPEEDKELELEFQRICNNQGNLGHRNPDFRSIKFIPQFVDKKFNSTGLQLADLTARPLALKVLRPSQNNRAAEIIMTKMIGWKVFP